MDHQLSNAELTLISLLAEKPRHAYDIDLVIKQRNLRDWTDLGFSSIYRLLTKFENQRIVDSEMTPAAGRGPSRKVYHLTEKGRSVWKQAVIKNLSAPDRKYSSFLLALDNLSAIPADEGKNALKRYLQDQIKINEHLSTSVDLHPLKDDFFIRSFFDYILNQQRAEIEWLQSFINTYEKHTSGV